MKRVCFILTGNLLMVLSCSSGNNEEYPFLTGKKFVYEVNRIEPGTPQKTDTISFVVLPHDGIKLFLGVTKIKWLNAKGEEIEKRGLNVKNGGYEIQMPITYPILDKEMSALSGHPVAYLNKAPGHSVEKQDKYIKGYGKLSGIVARQMAYHLKDSTIIWQSQNYLVHIYKTANVSHIDEYGVYECYYYFNKDLGFVSMNYHYPNDVNIKLTLVEEMDK